MSPQTILSISGLGKTYASGLRALDDVNLSRFLGLVHEFRNDAQLIIVSHQKRTMEAADCLYGVTMQPGGSSKVVSEKSSGS